VSTVVPVVCPPGQSYYYALCSSQCCPCAAGAYCPGDGKVYVCPANTFAVASSTNCTACPSGTISTAGSSSCSYQVSTQITTIAGAGTQGYNGDGIAATAASFTGLGTVLVDDVLGNIYVADISRIRMISKSTGLISTIVGTGSSGFNGDGVGISVQLDNIADMTFDPLGNVIFSDLGNHRIRNLSTSSWTVTTIANVGGGYHSGYGFSGDGGLAIYATIFYPMYLLIDTTANILYFGDNGNRRVRKVDSAGIISSIATTFNDHIGGLALNPQRTKLFFRVENEIHVLNLATGVDTTLYSPSIPILPQLSGSAAYINGPNCGMTSDKNGLLYISDCVNNRIITLDDKWSAKIIVGTSAQLNIPSRVSFDSYGMMYISDSNNLKIRTVRGKLYLHMIPL
jgi:hypothetical protein